MYTEEQKKNLWKEYLNEGFEDKLLSYIDYQLHNTELHTHSQKQNR